MADARRLDPRRTVLAVALALACIGAIVPFGISSDKLSNHVSTLEWVLAGLAAVALIGLVVELTTRWRAAWPFMTTGLVWTVITVYVAIAPTATFLWHLAHALMAGAFAVLALTAWRIESRGLT